MKFASIRSRLIAGLALIGLLFGALFLFGWGKPDADKPVALPTITLMSTIAAKWGEADIGEVAQGKARPALFYSALAQSHRLQMVDDLRTALDGKPDLFVMVQPRLLTPDEHLALDNWVRSGGKLLLFVDPALQWPSIYPLGDSRRPLFTSLLSPLLGHWGIELALPVDESTDEDAVEMRFGAVKVHAVSSGIWVAKKSGACKISANLLLADCRIGKGRAVLVADADLLQDQYWPSGLLESGNDQWVEMLVAQILAGKPFPREWDIGG
jgi:hypothetical protein